MSFYGNNTLIIGRTASTAAIWSYNDATWTSPDTNSFNITYQNGMPVVFNTTTSTTATISGTVTPSSTTVNSSSNATLTITGNLGGGILTLNGLGTLLLNGSNYYTDTVLSGGRLNTSSDTNLGTGSIIANGTTTWKNVSIGSASTTYSKNISIENNANLTLNSSSGGGSNFPGVISGSGTMIITHDSGLSMSFNGTNNTFSGNLQISNARLQFRSLGNGGTVSLGSGNTSGHLQYSGQASTPYILNRSFVLTGTTGNGIISGSAIHANNPLIITGSITMSVSGTKSLQLQGTNTGDNTISGSIGETGLTNFGLIKNDFSKWILSNRNYYQGNTNILNGTLIVDTNGLISGTTGKFAQAEFTSSSLNVKFSTQPTAGDTFRLFPGATTNTYSSPTLAFINNTQITNVTASYNSSNSTLTIS
jgi:fibronectin-binding autotransporter adhesin